jgi:predicted TIM-barrel fold metal-dependent hydrolase
MHFYDSRYPAAPSSSRGHQTTVEQYREVQAKLGLQRVVVVQPSTYGLDNRCTLDAVAEFRRGAPSSSSTIG